MTALSTIAVETLAGGATGALCEFQSSTADQLQKWTHTERGNSSGLCAPIPAVVYDDMQACELGRGDVSPVLSRIQIDRFLPLSQLRVRAVTGCGSLFHSSRNRACKPFARHTLPVKQLSQSLAYRNHHQSSFRNPSSFDGFNLSGRLLTNGQKQRVGASTND